MRVRVRRPDGSTAKLDLPNNSTYAALKEQVAKDLLSIDAVRSDQIALSLNKKTALEGDATAPLSALGIASGDLLFVLSEEAASGATQQHPSQRTPVNLQDETALHLARAREPTPVAVEDLPLHPADVDGHGGAVLGIHGNGSAAGPSAEPMDVDGGGAQAHASETMDSFGDDVHAHGSEPMDSLEDDVDATGIRRLSTYLERVCAVAGDLSEPNLALVLAVHAALLETGFKPNWMGEDYALPPGWQVGQAGAALSYQLEVGPAGPHPVCSVNFVTLGSALVVWGLVPDQSALNISLGAQYHHAGSEPCGLANVRDLWIKLKDKFTLPLFVAVYRSRGLTPPGGLLQLPTELKERILELLPEPARTLRVVAQVCRELRHLSSDDRLWRPLLEAEFGPLARGTGERGPPLKAVYRERLRERAQHRQRMHEMLAASRAMRQPTRLFPPFHTGFPGVVGGDFDRLPGPMFGPHRQYHLAFLPPMRRGGHPRDTALHMHFPE